MSEEGTVTRRCGYTAIPNGAISDHRLSIEARGLLALMMSFGNGWVYRASHLQKVCCVGADKYQRMIREIKLAGYLEITPKRDEDGKMSGYEYELFDAPENGISRQPGNPATGKPGHLRKTIQEENQSEELFGSKEPHRASDLFSGEDTTREVSARTVSRKDAEKEKTEEAFERFYQAYPLRKEKKGALAKFQQAVRSGIDPEKIIAAARLYAEWLDNGGPRDFRPAPKMPTTWLNKGCWDDELEAAAPRGGPSGVHRRSEPWGEVVR